MDTTTLLNELGGTTPAQEPSAPTTLTEVIGTTPDEVQPAETPAQPTAEPGYLAGKRAKWEAAHQAEMDELRGQLDTLREYFVQQEADKLVADGKISDREMALEYLRATKGMPAPATPAAPAKQARDEQGRFVAPDAAAKQRAAELVAQADTIRESTGVDVMALYNTDSAIRQKVLSGEWSFVDVFKNTRQAEAPVRAPAPIRSANGGGVGEINIRTMSSEQFKKLNEALAKGYKIDMR